MKAVILAGGIGTRISEESALRPKPMIEIGGKPILWHVMQIYSRHGVRDFIICLGYKGYMIKEYFANYALHLSDITIDFASNSVEVHEHKAEPWTVTLIDTGEQTMTGGRIKAIGKYLDPDEDFYLTYGDGVSDIDITALTDFHRRHGKLATLTAVQPPGRFGSLSLHCTKVSSFVEKPIGDGGWINGGFFVLSPQVLDYIEGPGTIWEQGPLANLAADKQLHAYKHHGFWHAMDTLRDKNHLESLWDKKQAPWYVWSDCRTIPSRRRVA